MNGPNKRNTRILDGGPCFYLLVVKVILGRTNNQGVSYGERENGRFLWRAKDAVPWPILSFLSMKKENRGFDTSRLGRAMNKERVKFGNDERALKYLGRSRAIWRGLGVGLRNFLVELLRLQPCFEGVTNFGSLSEFKI